MRQVRFEESAAFFSENGSGWMKLSKEAARDAVGQLLADGKAISGIEAGIWHHPGFEARIDGILSEREGCSNGITESEANAYFDEIDPDYDTFILTLRRIPKGTSS